MLAVTFFLAALLGASAVHKVLDRKRLGAVVARLTVTPLPVGVVLLALAATVEALAAIALLIPALRLAGAAIAVALWCVYGLALVRQRGAVLDCGCDLVARERPVDGFAILRPFVLAGLAALTLVVPSAAGWSIEAPFAALALLALWFAAGELHSIPVSRKAGA